MKVEYTIKNLPSKRKMICVGDLMGYFGEVRYKILGDVNQFTKNNTTKNMVKSLLRKVASNTNVDLILDNLEEAAKQNIFFFEVNGIDLLTNAIPIAETEPLVLTLDMREEYFQAQAIFDVMKPGFRNLPYIDYIKKRKKEWMGWFEKNLKKDYTNHFTVKILEE